MTVTLLADHRAISGDQVGRQVERRRVVDLAHHGVALALRIHNPPAGGEELFLIIRIARARQGRRDRQGQHMVLRRPQGRVGALLEAGADLADPAAVMAFGDDGEQESCLLKRICGIVRAFDQVEIDLPAQVALGALMHGDNELIRLALPELRLLGEADFGQRAAEGDMFVQRRNPAGDRREPRPECPRGPTRSAERSIQTLSRSVAASAVLTRAGPSSLVGPKASRTGGFLHQSPLMTTL